MLWGSIAAEATAALGHMPKGKSGGVNGRGCPALAFLRHHRRAGRERLLQHRQRIDYPDISCTANDVSSNEIAYRRSDLLRVLQQEHVAAALDLLHFVVGQSVREIRSSFC